MDKDKLLEAALALSPEDRAALAHEILTSLDGEPDEDVEEAWAKEIERRVKSIQDGTAVVVDWEDARNRIRQRLRDSKS